MSSFSPNQMRQCSRMSGAPCNPDKEQQLRDQIHNELAKIKYCANPSYECSQMRIEGSDYCIRHILRDPRGNYRQCSHVYSNGRKCLNAVAKFDNKKEQIMTTLCFEHNRQTQLQKTHLSVGRLRSRVETNETLLNNLAHHVNVDDIKPDLPKPEPDDDEIDVVSPYVVPFVNQDHRNSIGHIVSNVRKRPRILDYASDSSSQDEDPPCLRNTAKDLEFYESDYESVDSEDDDPLKHAGVYTRAEAVRIGESKLIKLRGLYMEQFTHLQQVLKQRRRKYLHEIRKERETYSSIHDQLKETPHERQLYDQLKALNSYHRRQGVEAVLHKKLKEKRQRDTVLIQKSSSTPKCVFTEGGVKCGERTLPCCKHCRKHILEDKRQVLFRACGVERSGVVCQEPVASILEDSTCVLHLSVATAKRQYIQKFYEKPTTQPLESIFATGHGCDVRGDVGGVDGFVVDDDNNSDSEMMPLVDRMESPLFDLPGGLFDFDVCTAEDLAKSLDDDCTFLLDIEDSELGLELGDNHNLDNGTNFDFGDIENGDSNAMSIDSPYADMPISPYTDIEDTENQDPNAMPVSNPYSNIENAEYQESNAMPFSSLFTDVELNDNDQYSNAMPISNLFDIVDYNTSESQDSNAVPVPNLYSDVVDFVENQDPNALYPNILNEAASGSSGVCPIPNPDQSFQLNETTSSVSEVLKILEGMEELPWFDALLD